MPQKLSAQQSENCIIILWCEIEIYGEQNILTAFNTRAGVKKVENFSRPLNLKLQDPFR